MNEIAAWKMSKVNRVCEVGDSESGDYQRWVEGRSVGKRSRQSSASSYIRDGMQGTTGF